MAFDQEDAFHDYEMGSADHPLPEHPERSPILPETHERLLSLEQNLTAALQRVRRYGRGHNRTVLLQRLESWQTRLASLLSRTDDLLQTHAAAFFDDIALFLHENFFQDLRKRHCKKGEPPYARYITDIHESLCKTSERTISLPVVHKTRAALDGVLEEGPFPFADCDAWKKNRIHLQSLEAYTTTLVDGIHHFQINCSPMRWRIVSGLWTRHAAHPSLDHTIICLRNLHRSICDGIGAIDAPTVHDFLPLLEETVHGFRRFLPHIGAALDDLGSSAQERLFLDALSALQTLVNDGYAGFHATLESTETPPPEEDFYDDDDIIDATAVPVTRSTAPSRNSAASQGIRPSLRLQHHPHRIALAVGAMIATLLHTHPSQEETPDIACATGAVGSDAPASDTDSETVAAPPENDAQKIMGDAGVDALIDGLLADAKPLAERLTDQTYFRTKQGRLLAHGNHDAEKAFALADADYPGGCTTIQQLLTSSSLQRDPWLWGQMAHTFNAVENAPF